MAVSKRLRYEVLRRDEYACRYCGGRAPGVELTVDHVTPKALGGTDTPDNLVACCLPCNSGKTSTGPDAPLVADVHADNLEWAKAVRSALAELGDQRDDEADAVRQFGEIWNSWTWTDRKGGKHTEPMPAGWQASIRNFLAAGLDLLVLDQCVTITMESSPREAWSYFCGICWRTLERAQRIAGERS